MPQTLELIIKATDRATSELGKIKGKFDGVNEALGAASVAMGTVTAGLLLAKKGYEDIIEPVMDYNRELRNLSEATGMSLDAAGRIVEVAEDAGISLPELATALEMATKNGFAPTLESIAGLADKIAGMNDPIERAEYLSKLLGRNWEVLLPLLIDGGPAFLALAAAVDSALIPTEQFVDDTERLRERVDALTESMEASKNRILIDLIPAFLDGADAAYNFLKALSLIDVAPLPGAPPSPGRGGSSSPGQTTPKDPWEGWHGPRALGGEVEVGTGGDAYTVGEHGAERFTPKVPGTITPSRDQLASSIDRMVKTLPTILIDAIERAK